MVDEIQKSSVVPIPQPQGIVMGRDPNVMGSVADNSRVEQTTQRASDAFSDYLEKSAVMSEMRSKNTDKFDITEEVLKDSPYKTGV